MHSGGYVLKLFMPCRITGHTELDVLINSPLELFELCFRQHLFGFRQADFVVVCKSLIPSLDIRLNSNDRPIVVANSLEQELKRGSVRSSFDRCRSASPIRRARSLPLHRHQAPSGMLSRTCLLSSLPFPLLVSRALQ